MSSKREHHYKMDKHCKKKKSKDTTFCTDSSMPFVCTEDKLTATIIGKPQSYKRTGGNKGIRYDQQKAIKSEFVKTLHSLYKAHGVPPKSFGRDNIYVNGTFIFARRNGNILNDVDNLSKFLLDCLQLEHNKISTCHNDNQVVKLMVEKKYGDIAMTTFTVGNFIGYDDNNNISSSSTSSSNIMGTNKCGRNKESAIDLTGNDEISGTFSVAI